MKNHIQFASSLIKFNLDNGPFITGSYMTWTLEKLVGNPTWLPDDLDICCTCEDQYQTIKKILDPLATDIKITNWLGHSSAYWFIEGFKFQAFVHPVPVEQRLNLIDYSVTAIAGDGNHYITGKNTFHDIANKVIRINDTVFESSKEYLTNRYQKYLDRGYKDLDDQTWHKIDQIVDTWKK
jgi:hypothetical protein